MIQSESLEKQVNQIKTEFLLITIITIYRKYNFNISIKFKIIN